MIRRFVLAVCLAALTVGALGTGVAGAASVPATGSASCTFAMIVGLDDPFDDGVPITTRARIAITTVCVDGLGDNTAGVLNSAMKTAQPGRVDVTGSCASVSLPAFHVKVKWWGEHGGPRFQRSRIEFPARTITVSPSFSGIPWTTSGITQWGTNPNQAPGSFVGQSATVSQLRGGAHSCAENGTTQQLTVTGLFHIPAPSE